MNPAAFPQAYQDEVTTAVLNDDWEAFRCGISLPCAVISQTESMVVAIRAEPRIVFNSFCDMLCSQKVTDDIRLVEKAWPVDSDLIAGCDVLHIIAGGQRVTSPCRSLMTRRPTGNRRRAANLTNGLADRRWPLVRLEPSAELSPNSEGPK
ncbi:MAG: hypothetical protein ACOH2H_15500 [Cypionkella sp.]